MKKSFVVILSLTVCGFFLGCTSSEETTTKTKSEPAVQTDHYSTAFPQRDISGLLEQTQESILRIITTNYYETYSFEKAYLTLADIQTNNPEEIATQNFSTRESTAGTSIILENKGDNVLLITCDHVVSSPDTVINYFEGENIPNNTFVQSVSIKQQQNNLVFHSRQLQDFKVIASDRSSDLALLSISLGDDIELNERPLNITLGNSNLLKTGSVLYALGFPRGYQMVTRGLASKSPNRNSRYFVTDALFNPGISGGIVLASKNGYRSFEWVGMARSASASDEELLVPRPTNEKYARAAKPYTDTVFVQQKRRINYGITQTIPINTIREFLNEHHREISQHGFDLRIASLD